MSGHDWIAMEEQLMKRSPEERALMAERIYQPPSSHRKGHLFSWLARLTHRPAKQQEEPQPARLKFG